MWRITSVGSLTLTALLTIATSSILQVHGTNQLLPLVVGTTCATGMQPGVRPDGRQERRGAGVPVRERGGGAGHGAAGDGQVLVGHAAAADAAGCAVGEHPLPALVAPGERQLQGLRVLRPRRAVRPPRTQRRRPSPRWPHRRTPSWRSCSSHGSGTATTTRRGTATSG